MSENLKLDKIINIAGTDYEVQAKTAEKVENKLTIYKVIGEATEEAIEFDGQANSEGKSPEVFVVPADKGGYFRGPINVPTVGAKEKQATQVLNYEDLSSVVTNLAGSGWYSWDGTNFATVTSNGVNQHVGIVLGNADDLPGFVSKNTEIAAKTDRLETEYYLPKFLYICTDTGNLYLGDCEENYRQIVNKAFELVSPTTNQSYTVDDIKTTFESLSTSVDTAESNLETAKDDLTEAYSEADAVLDAKINSNTAKITTLESWKANTIVAGTANTVKNAAYASNADLLDNKDSTYFQKKITISTSAPTSSDGEEGDVWIVWSNS